MKLSAGNGAACDGDACAAATGAVFALSVEIVEGPAEGYVGAQSFIEFGTNLTYDAGETAVDEVVWPDCEPAVAVRSQLSAETVSHGCLTSLPPQQPLSSYAGPFVTLAFTCSLEPSSTVVRLLPLNDPFAGTSGAKFVLDTGETVPAKVSDLRVDCVDVPTATPTSNPPSEPTSTPTLSPTPSSPVGDANCDGTVNPLDAALLLQLGAGLISLLPCPTAGDVNGDGQANALDAALVLQFSAGLLGSLPP